MTGCASDNDRSGPWDKADDEARIEEEEDEPNNSIEEAKLVPFVDPTIHITGTLSSASDEDFYFFEDSQATQCFIVDFAARMFEGQKFDWIGGEPTPRIEVLFLDGTTQVWYSDGIARMMFKSARYIKLSGLNDFHGDYEIFVPHSKPKFCDLWSEQGDPSDGGWP